MYKLKDMKTIIKQTEKLLKRLKEQNTINGKAKKLKQSKGA